MFITKNPNFNKLEIRDFGKEHLGTLKKKLEYNITTKQTNQGIKGAKGA